MKIKLATLLACALLAGTLARESQKFAPPHALAILLGARLKFRFS